MRKNVSALAIAFLTAANPVLAQTTAYNPAVQGDRFGIKTGTTFNSLGRVETSGGFAVHDPASLGALGYDPSRTWNAGDRYSEFLQVGDVDGKLLNISDLTPRQLANQAGIKLNQVPLDQLFGSQTLGDLIKLDPKIAKTPVEAIPVASALVNKKWGSSITSGLVLSGRYYKDVAKILEKHPELGNLPLDSVLNGKYEGLIDPATSVGLKELSKKLPEAFKSLPAKSLPALQTLSKGDFTGFASQGFILAQDYSKELQNLVKEYPQLEGVEIGRILKGDFSQILDKAAQEELKALDEFLPQNIKELPGKYSPILGAVAKGNLPKASQLGVTHVKDWQKLIEKYPHLAGLPFDQVLRGDVQAALPVAEQHAIFEIAKRLPEKYKNLPSDSLPAVYALAQGNWQRAVSNGVEISAREVQQVAKFFEKNPELGDLNIEQILSGNYDSAINAGSKRAVEELKKINPELGNIPVKEILSRDFDAALQKGIQAGGKKLIGQVIKNNPALENVAIGAIANPGTLSDIPSLADTALNQIQGIEGKAIADIPGLDNVPLDLVSANTIAALIKGDLFGHLDVPLGESEGIARNVISGGTRGKKLTPQPCNNDDEKTDNCSHIELTDRNGESLDGKQWVKGKSQKVKGGWGFLKNVLNNGWEKTGVAPWPVSHKTNNLKLYIKDIQEVGKGRKTLDSGFQMALESGYAEFNLSFGICIKKLFVNLGCTASVIDLPLEYFPEEILDLKVPENGRVLVATTSPAPKIPKKLIKRYRKQLGYPEQESYCSPSQAPTTDDGPRTFDDADPGDLIQVGNYNGRDEFLNKETAEAWYEFEAAAQDAGHDLRVISGYRSKATQQEIWDYKRSQGQTDEQIAQVNTRPGESEHHTGFAVDIGDRNNPSTDFNNGFGDSAAGRWVAQNAEKYGFELTYPNETNEGGIGRESWHYRYVGSDNAKQALKLQAPAEPAQPGDPAIASVNLPRAGVSLDGIREAIIGKESGYNYQAVNVHSGALGFGQVMPFNVASWTQAALGRAMTPNEFLNNPDAQITTINHRLGIYLDRELAATGGDAETAIRRVASTWYSGQPRLYDNPTPEYYNGGRYPSIRDYTLDVLDRYNQNPHGGQIARGGGVTCVASTGNGPFVQGDGVSQGNFINPVPGFRVNSPFGMRFHPVRKVWALHEGVDFPTPTGTPVGAIDGGVIEHIGWDDGWGNYVIVDHQNGTASLYAHLDRVSASKGAKVSQGQEIAKSGSTGTGTGPHLHLELYEGYQSGNIYSGVAVDPAKYIRF